MSAMNNHFANFWPQPPQFRPSQPTFRAIQTDYVRNAMAYFDVNNDFQLSRQESSYGARILDRYSAYAPQYNSLSQIFNNIATGLANNNPNLDTDGNGFLTYDRDPDIRYIRDPGPVELDQLAARDGNARSVSSGDFSSPTTPPWWLGPPVPAPNHFW
jgi:hypothetical protein